jgi:hypothetical protein
MKTNGTSHNYQIGKLIPMALHQFMEQWLKSLWDHITIFLKRWISPWNKFFFFFYLLELAMEDKNLSHVDGRIQAHNMKLLEDKIVDVILMLKKF